MTDLITRTLNDLVTRLGLSTSTPVPVRAVVRLVARAWSNVVMSLHFHIQWAAKQYFISQCDDDMLPQHGVELGMPQIAATFAIGPYTFSGTATTVIHAGTVVQTDDGIQYSLTADVTIGGGGTVSGTVLCLTAGADGNQIAGTTLTLASSLSGVNPTGTVGTGGILGGFDEETNDAYRARMLKRKRNPPQGGADADYEGWAESVYPNMRAWVRPQWMGDGTVGVLFVLDSQTPSIVPTTDEKNAVFNYINDPMRRPVTAGLFVVGPALLSIDISVTLVPDTPAGRTAAEAELADLLLREAEPGVCPALGEMEKAMSNADGVTYAKMVTTTEFDPNNNQLAAPGTVTYV